VIKRALPRQNELVNEIWISDRDRFVYHFAEAEDRLRQPLVHVDGRLQPATWTEALDLVAAKLQEHKAAAAGLTGDRLGNEDLYLFQKLFRKGLGSGNLDLADGRLAGGDIVAQVGYVSWADASAPERLGVGDAVLVVASDLHEEEPIWWLRAKQAADRGATLVVLNLRPTRLDEYATHVVHYQPGMALETVRQLLTAAKVETDSEEPLVKAAAALVKAENLVAFYGYEGLTYAETDILARLLGNLLLLKNGAGVNHVGRAHNGLIPVWPHNNTQGAWDMGIHPAFAPGYKAAPTMGLNARGIYDAAQSGELKALFVMGADPVGDRLMLSRGKLDFLVVQELFLTETAELADVVLPAQSWAERDGTFTSGERRIQRYYPATQSQGDTLTDWEILSLINERLGLGKPPVAASQIFSEISKTVPQYKGVDYRTLAVVEEQWPDVGHDDVYYGGTVYENRTGLGKQWLPSASESTESFDIFDHPKSAAAPKELHVVRVAALYTPGTLINHTAVLDSHLAQPTLLLNSVEADKLGLMTGDWTAVTVRGQGFGAGVIIDDELAPGLALLRGVPYFPGMATAEINKIEALEKEFAA
jgi:NADH-quinone oxidoreductase subunit G